MLRSLSTSSSGQGSSGGTAQEEERNLDNPTAPNGHEDQHVASYGVV